jgi:hypothetical protein
MSGARVELLVGGRDFAIRNRFRQKPDVFEISDLTGIHGCRSTIAALTRVPIAFFGLYSAAVWIAS